MMNHEQEQKERKYLLNRAYQYLKFRQRTKKEMYTYLRGKAIKVGIPHMVVVWVMNELERLGFLDDKTFVSAFVESRIRNKQRGIFFLKQELLQKGIDNEIINDFFSQTSINEEKIAKSLLQKVISKYSHVEKQKRTQKLMLYLQRKGFPYDIVKKTIEEIEVKE